MIHQNNGIIQRFSKRSVANLGFIEFGGLLSFKYKEKKNQRKIRNLLYLALSSLVMLVFNPLKHRTSQEQSLKRKEKKSYYSHNLVNHDEGILLLTNQVHTIFFFKKRRIKTTIFEGSNKVKYIYEKSFFFYSIIITD